MQSFGTREYTQADIEDIIHDTVQANAGIRGVTVCYKPYAFDADTKLFCPNYSKATCDFL